MILKVILVICIFYGIKLVLKASKIVSSHEIEKSKTQENSNDKIVEAEYTNISD
jgi:hypothetical protein